MKKKLLNVLLICICLTLCFAFGACGDNNNTPPDNGNQTPPDEETKLTSIFFGYNLPENCKLVWDEPSSWRKTLVKIGDDCVYTDVYLVTGSVVSSYYYKKTATGYTVYLDEGDGQGYSYNTTFTYQQAADEFKIEIGNKYFVPSITISRTSDPDMLNITSGTFATKKYVASPITYWIMSDYDILCKSDAYGITELTVFNTNITSFENAGVALNVR